MVWLTPRTATPCWSSANARRCAICGGGQRSRKKPSRSSRSMPKRVLVECRDLFFRGKLQAFLTASGAEDVHEEPYDLALIELGRSDANQRVTRLASRRAPVLAFRSHIPA